MRFPLVILFSLIILSCTKNNNNAGEDAVLYGKWQLTHYYISPGDYNVTWTAADPAHPSYVEFTHSGRMIFTGDAQPRSYEFSKLEEGLISAHNDMVNVNYGYSFEGRSLILSGGGCIEACLFKYKKVSSPGLPQ
jgi:hypothetical protein